MTPVSMKEEFSKETTKVATGSRIDEMGGCRCQFFLEGNLSLFELACSLSLVRASNDAFLLSYEEIEMPQWKNLSPVL